MQTANKIRYFLGANSPAGFYSLYDQLLPAEQARAIYILKGGPGCGKSTLMRRVAEKAEQAGEPVEYIQCSGDPDSLDGVVLTGRKIAIVDGTAPHVIEPSCPGAVESYVNLGECYDTSALRAMRDELTACMTGYKDCYKRAYRCLKASAEVASDTRNTLTSKALEEKILKRVKGIISRELGKPSEGSALVKKRFLSAVTHKGVVHLHTTAEVLCKRIYVLEDSYGLAHLMLSPLLSAATAAGHEVIVCPSPLDPDRIEHLLLPELSLAFLSAPHGLIWERRPYRRIRIDAMADPELLRRYRSRLRFSGKVSSALIDESVDSLAQAKAMHDELEKLYNPHVDFERVRHTADELADRILSE